MDSAYSSDAVADNPSLSRQKRSGSALQLSGDIKTRSIEKTLLPLLTQINTLVTSRAGSPNSQIRHGIVTQQHACRVGMLVAAAADKFVAVGESLAEEYPDTAVEMRVACNDVQTAALDLRRLTDSSRQHADSFSVVSTSRHLLSAITKVLLLADKLCVKQIVSARDRVSYCLQELESVSKGPTAALAEFVATFSELGRALVELAHLSGDRQADLRRDKDRESLAVSRATLERGTQLLLAAAKTCLRHPESMAAARVRDSILKMMREALRSVGQTLKETTSGGTSNTTPIIVPQSDSESSGATCDSGFQPGKGDQSLPIRDLVSSVKSLVDGEALLAGSSAVERLESEVNRLADALQDFTDCAYTPHASRERLLGLLDRLRNESSQISEQSKLQDNQDSLRDSTGRLVDVISFIQNECQRTADQLAISALENPNHKHKKFQSSPDVASDSLLNDDCSSLIGQLELVALSGDQTAFFCASTSFEQRADLAIEAARLYRHVAPTDSLAIDADHLLQWLRLVSNAISLSGQVLFEQYPNPVSRVSRESFRSFASAWLDLTLRLLVQLKEKCAVASQAQKSLTSSMVANHFGLFASPSSMSSPRQNAPQLSTSAFCSAESLSTFATPPSNGFRQSTLPRQRLSAGPPSRSSTSFSPQFATTSSLVRRSGSQPALADHLRQLRRHADNLSAMDGAVAAFSTGNGPLTTTGDLLLQAQFVAEQARTICRLSSIAASQLSTINSARDMVVAAVEKALGATGRLEAVLAMPAPVVPTTSTQNQQSAGTAIKNERVIASCHSAVVAAGSVVNMLLQSTATLVSSPSGGMQPLDMPLFNPPMFNSPGSASHRSVATPVQYASPDLIIGNSANRGGRRAWYSRSAANLAPVGAHPLSMSGTESPGQSQFLQQHRLV